MIQTLTAPAPAPLYVELARSLELLIENGTLRPGHRLPSVRRMSLQRDVSISTVLQAYTLLENRGWIEPGLVLFFAIFLKLLDTDNGLHQCRVIELLTGRAPAAKSDQLPLLCMAGGRFNEKNRGLLW